MLGVTQLVGLGAREGGGGFRWGHCGGGTGVTEVCGWGGGGADGGGR